MFWGYIINTINNGRRNGYFVDIGAHNGISFSNTYALEKYLDWNGLCVEVCDETFEKLVKNRKATCVNECVYSTSGIEMELEFPLSNPLDVGNDMLVKIKDKLPGGFLKQFETTRSFKKITKTLTEIFAENNVPSVIQYMSVDIEGSDLDALKGLDFSNYTIEFLTIEWGGGNAKQYLQDINSFLVTN